MRSDEEYAAVTSLLAEGRNDCDVARRTGVPRGTVRSWRNGGRAGRRPRAAAPLDEEAYAYLLGLYLGDGYLARAPRGVFCLRVTLDGAYPGIVASCVEAMERTMPGQRPWVRPRPSRAVEVQLASKRWPELFPQHGPGRKHERPIVLASWQQRIVDAHPQAFVRGLIHSDGCRSTNTVRVAGRTYCYPRYLFTNASDDIRALFCRSLDRLGVAWRPMTRFVVSVARRDAVATLDTFVGPKA